MSEDRAAAIVSASDWLGAQEIRPSPVIPALRSRFGLTMKEAIDAIRAAEGRREARPIER